MDESTILRLATITASVLVVVVSAGVARAALREKGQTWYGTIGGFAVSLLILLIGYVLATKSIYRGY